jgi:hypothetical protein
MGYNGQKPDGQRTPGQKLRTVFTGILDSLFKMNSMVCRLDDSSCKVAVSIVPKAERILITLVSGLPHSRCIVESVCYARSVRYWIQGQ